MRGEGSGRFYGISPETTVALETLAGRSFRGNCFSRRLASVIAHDERQIDRVGRDVVAPETHTDFSGARLPLLPAPHTVVVLHVLHVTVRAFQQHDLVGFRRNDVKGRSIAVEPARRPPRQVRPIALMAVGAFLPYRPMA